MEFAQRCTKFTRNSNSHQAGKNRGIIGGIMNLATIFGLAVLAIIAIFEIYIGLNDKDDEELILPAERNRCKESPLENTRTCMDPSYEIEASKLTLNTENGK
jgi:hypothetical protein